MQDQKQTVTSSISPIRKETAPITNTDDRYVLIDRGDYNRLVNNATGSNMLIICGLASFLIGAAALVMSGMKPDTVITQEKPIVIEKPVIVQCGLFGCSKKE
jgi:hypothetical protein